MSAALGSAIKRAGGLTRPPIEWSEEENICGLYLPKSPDEEWKGWDCLVQESPDISLVVKKVTQDARKSFSAECYGGWNKDVFKFRRSGVLTIFNTEHMLHAGVVSQSSLISTKSQAGLSIEGFWLGCYVKEVKLIPGKTIAECLLNAAKTIQ